MKYLMGCAVAMVAMVLCVNVNDAQDKKTTIKSIMKAGMKAPAKGEQALCAKVASGKASAEEKAKFVELAEALAKLPCPKGDAASWKANTEALVAAAKAGDGKAVGSSCKKCHDSHK